MTPRLYPLRELTSAVGLRRLSALDDGPPVVCFPPAGGHSVPFRALAHALADRRSVHAFELVELDASALDPAEIARCLLDWSQAPLVILGHSFGGLLGAHVAAHLVAAGRLHRTVVCGSPPPGFSRQASVAAAMPDDRLVEHLTQFGGVPKVLQRNSRHLAPYLDRIRCDLAALDALDNQPLPALIEDLVVIAGTDDAYASTAVVQGWDRYARNMKIFSVPGTHFFIEANAATIAAIVEDAVSG